MSYSNNRYRGQSRSPRSRNPRNNQEFNPSALIQNARVAQAQPEYIVKHQFNDFAIDERLKQNIRNCGYSIPTPIQDQAIPHILENKDLIGLANTGTGKTAAFLIPLINNLLTHRDKKVLIMTPTRELANQIDSELRNFSRGLKLFSALCIGGTSMSSQISNLKRRPHFVIGTPGRLIDLYKRNKLDLNIFSIVVLDEVDRMLDMGFISDMEFVVSKMPVQRQTLFFSATLPHKLDQTVSQFLKNPVTVQTAMRETLANVNQAIIKINGQSKVQLLQELLSRKGFDKVLVFGRTKHGLNRLLTKLCDQGFRATIIHGNKSQNQREKALNQFKNNAVQVLLATDVASRGLDINDVTHVINFDLPKTHEDYIHRIGRTARANKTGVALSFVE